MHRVVYKPKHVPAMPFMSIKMDTSSERAISFVMETKARGGCGAILARGSGGAILLVVVAKARGGGGAIWSIVLSSDEVVSTMGSSRAFAASAAHVCARV